MKRWKTWQISLFIAISILINFGGRTLAAGFRLPLWLDSFGTVLSAYVGGPVTGAIVGLTSNLLYSLANHISAVYALTSIALGVIVGLAARKESLKSFFGTMSVSTLAALVSTAISVPLNCLYSDGSTGNMWGDGVRNYLGELGYPKLLTAIAGEFYVDFVDKVLTLVALYAVLRFLSFLKMYLKARRAEAPDAGAEDAVHTGAATLLLALAVSASLAASPSSAQAADAAEDAISYNDYVQTVYDSSNGLPCGEANDIAETKDGILWIGTYAGLYRYNGTEFRWMDNYESVRNVNCLFVDAEGRLFIGTNDNGLSICIGEQIVNVLDQSAGLPSNSVRCITQGADGYYYIGTTGSMQILTLNNGMKRVNTLSEINYADNIARDEKGHVAAVTSNGRLFLLREGTILCSLMLEGEDEQINCCGFDEDGYLLAGTSLNHLYVFDISGGWFNEKNLLTLPGMKSINDMHFPGGGEVFLSADNGIGYIDASHTFHSVNVNGFNNSIDNMLVDYQGNYWFTSSRLGLLRLSPSPFRDVYSTAGMTSHVVNAVTYWQDAFYFGTDKGLDAVDASCRTEVENALTDQFEDVRIRCLLADSSDHLWICTYGQGLVEVMPDGTQYLYNAENGSFGSRARLVSELSDHTILAAGDTGISFIRDHGIVRTIGYENGLINSMILTVTELPDGHILAGTDGDGIAVLENLEVTHMLTRNDGLSSGVILRTVRDPASDGVFIVTSNGLCYMDEDGSIRPLNNFPYFNNYDIWVKNRDTLFVTGSAGIYVVDRAELLSDEENISYDLLDARKGLGSALTANSWNYDDGEGNLFLASDRGVFIADTDRYRSDNRSYRMMISSYALDSAPHQVRSSTPIRISRGIRKIELFPEIINFTIQDPDVGYYLEGFEKDWNILPQSQLGAIAYTNLPTGEYTFHLAVFDSSRSRTLEERTYTLIKDREIYDNHYFKIYMLAVAMAAVAWFTWFLVVRQVRRTLEMQRRELQVAQQQIQMGNETIIAIAKAVDAKDERTSQHSYRVSEYSYLIGHELGLSDKECENLRKAARMHDIGKIGVPDSILNKPARLTDEEYAVMKTHTTRGGEILKDFTLIDHVVEGALYHHERYDGRGYPHGLKGDEIPLYARIIGVADAFDAMTANRVYRKQMDFGYVLGELQRGRGTQFDPQMVDILLRLLKEGKINLKELYPELKDTDIALDFRSAPSADAGAAEQKAAGAPGGAASAKNDAADAPADAGKGGAS